LSAMRSAKVRQQEGPLNNTPGKDLGSLFFIGEKKRERALHAGGGLVSEKRKRGYLEGGLVKKGAFFSAGQYGKKRKFL